MRQSIHNLEANLTDLIALFDNFRCKQGSKSKLLKFWDEYGSIVNILLALLRPRRTGNWQLHLSSIAAKIPYFFALDRQNHSRYFPVYLADMQQLETSDIQECIRNLLKATTP